MSRIAGVATALPEHRYPQAEITDAIAPLVTADPAKQAVLRRLHAGARVDTRHLVLPLEQYRDATTFTESNGRWIEAATALAATALQRALDRAGLAASDIDHLLFTSVTGASAPSIDALLVPLLGLRDDVKRIPVFGLGCVAGAAGIARVHDYLRGAPSGVAALVAVELCSLTVQRGDDSMANLVASGIFGDGAAAVVLVGDEHPAAARAGIDVVDTASRLYPDSGDVIGFHPGESGFRITLTAGVADLVDARFHDDAEALLHAHGLTSADLGRVIAHPGGPRVLEAFARALDLDDGVLEDSWRSMAEVGNLSSVSVLHILERVHDGATPDGTPGLLFALGPGVTAEIVLLRWADARAVAAADAIDGAVAA